MAMNPRLLRPTANDSPASIPGLALWLDASASDALYTTDAGPVSAVSSPLDIGGCQLWLDASDAASITASSGEVTAWADKSPTGSSWTRVSGVNGPATGTQTMGGKNVVVFDGVDDGLSAVTPLSTSLPMSFFIVQRIVSATSFGMSYVSGAGSDDFNVRQSSTSGRLNIVAGNGIVFNETSGASRAGIDDIVSWVVPSSTNSSLFRGGSGLTLDSATLKPVLSGTHYIGRRSDGFYLNGYIAEIIVYNTALSTSDRARVEAYLANKWGISGVHAPAVTASDPVGYWRDRSGNGRHATQSTAASRPVVQPSQINSRAVIRFDGTDDRMAIPSLDAQAFTVICVGKKWSATTDAFIALGNAANFVPYALVDLTGLGTYGSKSTGGTNGAFAGTAARRLLSTSPFLALQDSDISIRVDGAPLVLSDTGTSAAAVTAFSLLGARTGGGNIFGKQELGEILYYSRALSTAERRKVEVYLARRWGITLAPQVSNAEAQDWINRVYAAGSTVSQPVANAVSAFVDGCQADGIWDAMKSVVLLAGADTLAGALAPLKGTAPTSSGFVSGDYSKTAGLTSRAAGNTFLDTNRAGNADPQDSFHAAVYLTNIADVYVAAHGASGSGVMTIATTGARNRSSTAGNFSSTALAPTLVGTSRSSGAAFDVIVNGTVSTVSIASSTPASENVKLPGYVYAGIYSNNRFSFYSIGEAVDLALLDARVNSLMSSIGVT